MKSYVMNVQTEQMKCLLELLLCRTSPAHRLERPEIRPAGKRRKRPWNRGQNNQKCNGKPDRYCFKFCIVCMFSFCFGRSDGNDNDGNHHHQAVFHSEKAYFPLMNCILVVMQKIINNGADKIKPKSQNQLDVRNGCCPVAC